jgi:hypothetical protein
MDPMGRIDAVTRNRKNPKRTRTKQGAEAEAGGGGGGGATAEGKPESTRLLEALLKLCLRCKHVHFSLSLLRFDRVTVRAGGRTGGRAGGRAGPSLWWGWPLICRFVSRYLLGVG